MFAFVCVCVSLDILNELLQRENRVLHFWTMRKRRLDQCQQYVVFERSAKQVHETHFMMQISLGHERFFCLFFFLFFGKNNEHLCI